MKKILSVLLITVCLLFNANTAFAENFAVTVENKVAECGDTVVINVDIENNTGIIAAILRLTYDRERLQLISAEDKNLLKGAVFSRSEDVYPYVMVWNSASPTNFTNNGTLVSLKFKVKDDAESGKAFINLDYDEDDCFDVDLNNVPLLVSNGSITVEYNNDKRSVHTKSSSARETTTIINRKTEENNDYYSISGQIITTVYKIFNLTASR